MNLRVGVVLPTFRDSLVEALGVAADAARLGIDGVFCYDHLWPMGDRSRPAFAPFPVLAHLAATHPGLTVGTLVARIGLVSDAVLEAQFRTLAYLAPGRVIAALGTGDKLNREENDAYGIAYGSADERRASLASVADSLQRVGIEVWIGGFAAATRAIAHDRDLTVNLWGVSIEELKEEAKNGPVTWAGPAPAAREALQEHLELASRANASWVVYGWPVDLEALASFKHRL